MPVKNARNLIRNKLKSFLFILLIANALNCFSQKLLIGVDVSFHQRLYNYFPSISFGGERNNFSLQYSFGRGVNNFWQTPNGTSLHCLTISYGALKTSNFIMSSGFSFNYALQRIEYLHHYLIPEFVFKSSFGNKFKITPHFGFGIYNERFKSSSSTQVIVNYSFSLGTSFSYDL